MAGARVRGLAGLRECRFVQTYIRIVPGEVSCASCWKVQTYRLPGEARDDGDDDGCDAPEGGTHLDLRWGW